MPSVRPPSCLASSASGTRLWPGARARLAAADARADDLEASLADALSERARLRAQVQAAATAQRPPPAGSGRASGRCASGRASGRCASGRALRGPWRRALNATPRTRPWSERARPVTLGGWRS